MSKAAAKCDEDKVALQKLRIALSSTGVEKALADRVMELVERLQGDILGPELLSLGEDLATVFREIDQKAKQQRQDIVADACASVIRVERLS